MVCFVSSRVIGISWWLVYPLRPLYPASESSFYLLYTFTRARPLKRGASWPTLFNLSINSSRNPVDRPRFRGRVLIIFGTTHLIIFLKLLLKLQKVLSHFLMAYGCHRLTHTHTHTHFTLLRRYNLHRAARADVTESYHEITQNDVFVGLLVALSRFIFHMTEGNVFASSTILITWQDAVLNIWAATLQRLGCFPWQVTESISRAGAAMRRIPLSAKIGKMTEIVNRITLALNHSAGLLLLISSQRSM
jgi:hypothetical protein